MTGAVGGQSEAALAERARHVQGVAGAAPFIETQALLIHGTDMQGATLRGIDPRRESDVTAIARSLVEGELSGLTAGTNRIVLGRSLAFELGVAVGDEITLMVPTIGLGGELAPRLRAFTVAGLFEVGLQDHDSVLALAAFEDVSVLLQSGGSRGIRVVFDEVFDAPIAAPRLASVLGPGLVARDWTVENAGYFRAIRIEKTMMTLILLLVVAVAAFNIVAMLVMVVRAKRTDIAILRTLGLSPAGVVKIFLSQGVAIGWGGSLLGVGLGLSLSFNVQSVVGWLERHLHFQVLDSDVYYVTRIPSAVQMTDVWVVVAVALVLTLAATIYPARQAAATEPADALRYE